jgi:hypothetical protein
MQDGRSIARLFLNYMVKHGDTLDHDAAQSALNELDAEDSKSLTPPKVHGEEVGKAHGEKVEGTAEGRGVQLTLPTGVEAEDKATPLADASSDKKPDNKK